MRKMNGKNKAGKLVSAWSEYYGNEKKYIVGVQGTSYWYSFNTSTEAKQKFSQLLESEIC